MTTAVHAPAQSLPDRTTSVDGPVDRPDGRVATTRIQRVRTALGLEAWLVEDYTVPLFALEFAFEGGGTQDVAGKAGTANILSGLLEEGAGDYDNLGFQSRIEDLALDLSFHAGRDHFGGSLRSLIRHRDAAFEMLRLALVEAHLAPDAIERMRAQIVAGMKHEENDPNEIAAKAWQAAAFDGHPYAHPVRGSYDSVRDIGRDDLVQLRTRLFARSSVRIAVVGALDASTLAGLLDRVFGDLPADPDLVSIAPTRPQRLGTRSVIDLDVPQSVIRFGAAAPLRNTEAFIPAFVVNHILGGGVFSARLFKEVREKRGLAYSVYSTLAPGQACGLFIGGTATKNERAAESLAVIEEQIADLAESGPTREELASAKKYLTGSYALRFDTSSKIAGQLVQIQLDDLGIDYIDRRNALIETVDMDVAREAARNLLGSGKLLVTIVGRPQGL